MIDVYTATPIYCIALPIAYQKVYSVLWCADGQTVVRCIIQPFFYGGKRYVLNLGMTIRLPVGDDDCIQCGQCTEYGMLCVQTFGFVPYTSNNFYMTALYMHFSYMQWRRQNFSAADRGTARAPEFRLSTFKKLCVPSLFLVEASSYTVRTNGRTHGKKKFCVRKW